MEIDKPWGKEKLLGTYLGVYMKELYIDRHKATSYHYHPTKDEVLYVVLGKVVIMCGEQYIELEEGDHFFIPAGLEHSIVAKEHTIIFEIASMAQSDTVRIRDIYGRTDTDESGDSDIRP